MVDLAIAISVGVVLTPLGVAIAMAIKLSDGGPILYAARRVGRGGRTFAMYKFRTMVVDAEKVGGSSTSDHDPRITKIGHHLRRWKFDEIPQLINVFRGEMSLVGPRPQVEWDVERYTLEERRLLSVKPGVTDWASIRFRNEGRILAAEEDPEEAYDRLIRPEKIVLGLAYVDEASMRTDIKIMIATIRAVVGTSS
ncbi:sugar transferase [Nocardioides sp. JS614]|nr:MULTISPECIES: sugar transferase [unclassified Nocardioides]ABL83716.1 sugar transferase [Nocardioides sp. JS614]